MYSTVTQVCSSSETSKEKPPSLSFSAISSWDVYAKKDSPCSQPTFSIYIQAKTSHLDSSILL